ncbi:MAG: hypothetical protein AAGC73_03840 [Verrucomicrobiota bacterium]
MSAASLIAIPSTRAIDLYRVPEATPQQLERIPKNLARWHMGATLILTENGQFQRVQVPDVAYYDESIFLSDNSALTYKIATGQHNYIIDLGQFMRLSRFFMNNESAAGTITLKSSDTLEPVNSAKWVPLNQPVSFSKGVIPSVSFSEIETRYLMVSFDISDTGLIGNFGATGPMSISQATFNIGKGEDSSSVQKAASPIIDFDFASFFTGSRVVFISGGDIENVHYLLDEDPSTTYAFPEGEESVMILDLRKETKMSGFNSKYVAKSSGEVQVYMLDHLPTYFYEASQPTVATLTDQHGMVQRAELASYGKFSYDSFLAAQSAHQVVSVPTSYFDSIENAYSEDVMANDERTINIISEIERRYVVFRFIPSQGEKAGVQSAVYRPGDAQFQIQQAQSGSGISFGGVQVIGDVEFEDIFVTMDEQITQPGPAGNTPLSPPQISQ